MEILVVLILLIPTAVEATADYYEWFKGIRDKKGRDMFFRSMGMILAGIVVSTFGGHTWWQGAIYSAGLFILFFDYTMGWLLKRNPFFLGTTSKLDKLWYYAGPPWSNALIRIIIMMSLATVYYDIDKFGIEFLSKYGK